MKRLMSFFNIGETKKSPLKIEKAVPDRKTEITDNTNSQSTGITIPKENDYEESDFSDF